MGNSVVVAIGVIVFPRLHICLLRMFGLNLWEFTALPRQDCSFDFCAISIEHFGNWGVISLVAQ